MSFLTNAFSGITNQYTPNSAYAPGTQATVQNLQPAIDTANAGYGQSQQNLQSLIQMLQQQAQGNGPNLANAQLQSATGQNVANQAALMAGQRGASQNVGLIARQAGQQGAAIQQQAAGQAAQNRLAEQLAATSQLGNAAGTQGSLANTNLGIQQGAMSDQNRNILGNIQGINTTGAQIAQNNTGVSQNLLSGAGQLIQGFASLADGGALHFSAPQVAIDPALAVKTEPDFATKFVSGMKPKATGMPTPDAGNTLQGAQIMGTTPMFMAADGGMPLPFGPLQKENYTQPMMVSDFRRGGPVKAPTPQQKATVPGNSLKNDKIPAMMSEGEVVLPREVTMSANAPQQAARFMAEVMAGKHRKKV